MNVSQAIGVAFGLAIAGEAAGQAGFIAEVIYSLGERSVHPGSPEATLRMSAFFTPPDFAFASARWDIVASEPAWTRVGCIPPNSNTLHCLGPGGPVLGGASITGVTSGQIHFPPSVPANPANPYGLVDAVWSTADFRLRRVPVGTRTARFDVYISESSPASQNRMGVLVEGSAEVRVTPARLCDAECDTTTGFNSLDIFDFLCFQNEFAAAAPYACDFDTSTGPGVCDVLDFLAFQNAFAAGCP